MKKIHWPTALVLISVVLVLGALALFGRQMGLPEAWHDKLRAGLMVLGTLLMSIMQPLLSRDSDGDGIPNVIDADSEQS